MKLPVPQSEPSVLETLQRYCKRFSAMINVPVLLLGTNGELVSASGLNVLHAQAHLQLPFKRINLSGFQAFQRSNGLRDLHLPVPLDGPNEGTIVIGPFTLQWDRDNTTSNEKGAALFGQEIFEEEWNASLPELKDENLELIGQFHRKTLEILRDSIVSNYPAPHSPQPFEEPIAPRIEIDNRKVSRLLKPYMEKMAEDGLLGFAMFEILYDRRKKPLDFRLVGTNKGSKQITELDEQTYLGQLVSRVAHPSWFAHFFMALDLSEPYRFEEYSPLIGKTLRCIAEKADETHIVVCYTETGSSADKTLSSRHPHHELFEAWLLSTPLPFAYKNKELQYEIANPAFCRLVNLDETDILGKTDFDLFDEEEAQRHQEKDLKAIYQRTALQDEEEMTCDLEKRQLSVTRSPVFDKHGEPSGVLFSTGTNGTTLGVEHDMDQSEQKYRFIADNITDMIWMTDMTFSLTYVSPSVETLCGFKPEEAIGLQLHDRMTESSLEKAMKWIPEALVSSNLNEKQDNSLRMELDFIHKNGNHVTTETIITLLQNEDGENIGLLGVSRNISSRRKTDPLLKQKDFRIQENQKLESLRHMAGGVAHDFNNLLTGIMGNVSLALMDLNPESPIYDFLKDVEHSAFQASELAMQMLAYSGKGRVIKAPLHVTETINSMRHIINATMNLGTTLSYRLHEMNTFIEADSVQFQQLVLNLVTNAVEAVGRRNGEIIIETGEKHCDRDFLSATLIDEDLPEGSYAFVKVSDSGAGMDPATLSRIFDPFFSTKFTGRGLGLATVIGIIRGHSGTITVDSSLGKGSVFTAFFPVMESGSKELEIPESKYSTVTTHTVLIADDESVVRRMMERTLSRNGMEIFTASNGFEAIAKYQKHKENIDLIILDLTMPKMGGEQALEELRHLGCKIPILLTSGYNRNIVLERFQGKTISGFLQKPFSSQELVEQVNKTVSKEK